MIDESKPMFPLLTMSISPRLEMATESRASGLSLGKLGRKSLFLGCDQAGRCWERCSWDSRSLLRILYGKAKAL